MNTSENHDLTITNESPESVYISYSIPWAITSLTHWGRATHICVSKFTIIASDNGLSPGRRQAIIWNNAGILSIGLLGTNFSEILIEILTLSFKKMRLKVSSAKWRLFCLGLNVLSDGILQTNVGCHYLPCPWCLPSAHHALYEWPGNCHHLPVIRLPCHHMMSAQR